MEYAEKMYLVPGKNLEDLRGEPENIRNAAVRRLDSDMRGILLRTDLSEYEKAKLYTDVLRRFLTLNRMGEMEKNPILPDLLPPPPPPPSPPSLPPPPEKDASIREILEGVHARYRKNAELLLNKLSQHKDVSSWDDRGSFLYRGKALPGSNILDLIRGVTHSNAIPDKRKPQGWDIFLKALAEINMPTSLVGNMDVRQTVETLKIPSLPPKTPRSRPKRPFKRPPWLKLETIPETPPRDLDKKPEWLTF